MMFRLRSVQQNGGQELLQRDMEGSAKSAYRPDIDGLRAIAVSLVVVFHAFPASLPGGFLGVDIFFVISGFLITKIIATGLDRGSFSFLTFYGRRVRRIFPALILVLTIVMTAAFKLQGTAELQLLAKHALGAVLFVPNFIFWNEAGYFDVSAETKPLLHTWSLGVEEQFYIIWPALMVLAHRRKFPLLPLLAAITIASFVYSCYVSATEPTEAFYSPLSRAWELSIGSILSLLLAKRKIPLPAIASTIGMIALALSAMFFHGDMPLPAPMSLIPVLGACAIIAAGSSAAPNRFLSSRPLVAVGLVSYPFYLWHWPLMAFARLEWSEPSKTIMIATIVSSFALAAATYWIVERSVQRHRLIHTAPYLLLIMTTIGVCAGVTMRFDARTLWYPEQIKKILEYSNYDYGSDARLHKCWLTEENDFSLECGFNATGKRRLAVWGDSHAARLYPGLASITSNVAQYTVSSCPPSGNSKPYCESMNAKALALLSTNPADTVVLFARWSEYTDNWSTGGFGDGLRNAILHLRSAGSHVVLIGPFPEFPKPLPDLLFDRWWSGLPIEERISGLPSKRTQITEDQLRAIAADTGAQYVSLIKTLCNAQGCLSRSSMRADDLISWDYGHLTSSGSKLVANTLNLKD